MSVTFQIVKTAEDLDALAALAHEIWFEYWPAIIGEEQTAYMVEQFQSLEAIKRGIAQEGYRYWFIVDSEAAECAPHGRIMGYTGGYAEDATNRWFISKIYLLNSARGRGYCSKTIAFYEDLCRQNGWHAMYLTVNKHNELGIRAYKGKGFDTIDSVVNAIGEGFVMDDYIMEKAVEH